MNLNREALMSHKRLITTGCSFTAGSSNIPTGLAEKSTWVHNLLEPWNIEVLVNLAMSGGGNIASSYNLKWFVINHTEFSCDNTTILFNLTGLDRYDLLVDTEHPDANDTFSWAKYLNFSWLTSGGFVNAKEPFKTIYSNCEYDQVVKYNQMAIIDLFTFVESKNFEYAFMCMDNNILDKDKNAFFSDFIDERKNTHIRFDGDSMHEFCKKNNLLDEDGFHPSSEGYYEIAQHVIQHFNKKG